jgi:hypothetical protein
MTDDWLRDALDDAVSDVEPGEALDSIRARTKVTPMSRKRPWLYGAAGAVLATAATITAFAVVDSDNDSAREDPGVAGTPSSSAGETRTDPPSDPPTESPSAQSLGVPVYYLGEVTYPQGENGGTQTAFRLYREWHQVEGVNDDSAAEEVARATLDEMFDGAALDEDYASLWTKDIDAVEVTHEGGVITVDLTGPVQSMSVGSESGELSLQQLVYTVQGALALMKDPSPTDPVRLLVDGKPVGDLWGHIDASEPIVRAEQTGTQAPIWVISPQDGETVAMPFSVTGVAQAFEANVSWRVLKDGVEVDQGFTTASEGAPAFGDFAFDLKGLDPGTYVLEVFEASPLDGSSTFVDSKRFTVE